MLVWPADASYVRGGLDILSISRLFTDICEAILQSLCVSYSANGLVMW